MKQLFTLLALLTLACTCLSIAQTFDWQPMGIFPPAGLAPKDTIWGGDIHGLAVDPAGKVWVQKLGNQPGDSLVVSNYMADVDTSSVDSIVSRKINVRALHVYNANGTEASFSPIYYVNLGGKNDTLGGASTYVKGKLVWHPSISVNTGRGLRADQNGNILATYFGNVYRINYVTGAGMAKGVLSLTASAVAVGVSNDGYVYGNVVAADATPLKILNPDLTFLSNAVPSLTSFSRAISVSKDGNDIYYSGYTNHAIYRYHSDLGVLGDYLSRVDTVMKGFDCESYCWNPKSGKLFASTGSFNDFPNRWPGLATAYDTASWYAYDPVTNTVGSEHIKWTFFGSTPTLKANERPRAIAFSPGGDTAYVGVFGATQSTPGLRRYRRVLTSVEPIENGVPSTYSMSQNYPNPFNPSTEIQFTVSKGGMTTVKVYDILGKEVATLVNENLAPGTFKTRLDASRFSSGTYFYTLISGDARITKKMMLLK